MTDAPDHPYHATKGLILGLIGVLIFSGTLPATRVAVSHFEPWFLTFGRATLAGLAAIACLTVLRRKVPAQHIVSLFMVGMLLVYGFPGFVALAMVTVPSSHGGVMLGVLPLLTALFAALIGGERPSLIFWVLGVLGTLLVCLFALREGGWHFQSGDFWLFAAGLSAGLGYVISGKLSRILPGWEVICWALVLTLPLSFAGSYVLWQPHFASAPIAENLGFLYVAFGSMFLGFFAWNTGLSLGGLARVGQLQLLQPFGTLAIAAVILGESISISTVGFTIAIVVIVALGRLAKVDRKHT